MAGQLKALKRGEDKLAEGRQALAEAKKAAAAELQNAQDRCDATRSSLKRMMANLVSAC